MRGVRARWSPKAVSAVPKVCLCYLVDLPFLYNFGPANQASLYLACNIGAHFKEGCREASKRKMCFKRLARRGAL